MSDKINDGGSAFPSKDVFGHEVGMTLRDWFAGQALMGLLADTNNMSNNERNADIAYNAADEMLKRRNK